MRSVVSKMMAAAAVLALASTAMAGVYDDVTAWWHLDHADSGAITTAAEASDQIRDQRLWGDNDGFKATGVMGTPEWTSTGVPATGPAGGLTRGGRALALDDSAGSEGFEVNNLSVTGDATLFARVKWDGSIEHGGAATIYLNGFGWSANKGWMLRLVGTGQPQFYYGKGNSTTASDITLTPDTWHDLAVVLDENGANDTITFYRNAPGGELQTVTKNVSWFNGEVNSTVTRVGYEGTDYKHFGGELESIALWDRALSTAEIQDAFRSPDPAWSLGIDNGTSDDMAGEWLTDADHTLGEPWHEMRRAVTSTADEANVTFSLDPHEVDLSRVFHIDAHSSGGSIAVEVNGHPVGAANVAAWGDFDWLIDGSLFQQGTNTLSIQHAGGSYVSWDWMELGGGWQVGYDNNTQSEFAAEGSVPDDYYVTDPNWKHLERALTAGQPHTNIHFNLSDVLSDYSYLYTTEVIAQGGGDHPFDVLVNGYLLASLPASPDNTVWDLTVSGGWLHPGDNVITLRYGDTAGWLQFDYHRLQPIPEPATLSLLGLGALALLRRRRTH